MQEEAAGSAFFRYSRVKAAHIRDFPRQFSLNIKPLVLSLSGATGLPGESSAPGCVPWQTALLPQESPGPLCHCPHHTALSCRDKWGSHPGETETPEQPSATASISLFLSWLPLQLNKAVELLGAGLTLS